MDQVKSGYILIKSMKEQNKINFCFGVSRVTISENKKGLSKND